MALSCLGTQSSTNNGFSMSRRQLAARWISSRRQSRSNTLPATKHLRTSLKPLVKPLQATYTSSLKRAKGIGTQNPAWGSYEYPALTRNPNIRNIYRVDLDLTEDPAQSMSDPDRAGPNNPQGTPVLIWKQGDPPSDVEPAGDRARKNVIHSPLTEVFPVPLGSGLKRRRIQG